MKYSFLFPNQFASSSCTTAANAIDAIRSLCVCYSAFLSTFIRTATSFGVLRDAWEGEKEGASRTISCLDGLLIKHIEKKESSRESQKQYQE